MCRPTAESPPLYLAQNAPDLSRANPNHAAISQQFGGIRIFRLPSDLRIK